MYVKNPLEQRFEFTPRVTVVATLEQVAEGRSEVVWRLNGARYSVAAHGKPPGPFPQDMPIAEAHRQIEEWADRILANPMGAAK